jgi:hypothetical protein
MVDARISRVRLRALARLGRSRLGRRPASRPPAAASAARRQAVADASSIADALSPRPRAASPRPETGDLVASTI